jgi:hypothetical protein
MTKEQSGGAVAGTLETVEMIDCSSLQARHRQRGE